MKNASIRVMINGQWIEQALPVQQTLLSFLRDTLRLTAVKCGCNAGECGACMVLLNNQPVNSCMILAVECDSKHVDTLEGLNAAPLMRTLQEAFLDAGAVQCGFCTPGMLISAYAFLRDNPSPTDEEVMLALSGNLCRCTGYQVIVQAVQKAAAQLRAGE
jgi:aerobic-type carbon monoxide dehydrogenase small subunit (CoxS/CutS family)